LRVRIASDEHSSVTEMLCAKFEDGLSTRSAATGLSRRFHESLDPAPGNGTDFYCFAGHSCLRTLLCVLQSYESIPCEILVHAAYRTQLPKGRVDKRAPRAKIRDIARRT
jgi:hypothetical protein